MYGSEAGEQSGPCVTNDAALEFVCTHLEDLTSSI